MIPADVRWTAYIDGNGVRRQWWDDATRTYHEYDAGGVETLSRPYTPAENADADARRDNAARLDDHERRIAALEAIVLANQPTPAPGSEPTFAVLTGRQNGAIYEGQRFLWTDGQVWYATTGPLNSGATPATYPLGYALLNPPSAPAWKTGTAYAVGDLAAYSGTTYRCVQAHTSQAGWEPPAVPALWAIA